jgi:hypothetical protein
MSVSQSPRQATHSDQAKETVGIVVHAPLLLVAGLVGFVDDTPMSSFRSSKKKRKKESLHTPFSQAPPTMADGECCHRASVRRDESLHWKQAGPCPVPRASLPATCYCSSACGRPTRAVRLAHAASGRPTVPAGLQRLCPAGVVRVGSGPPDGPGPCVGRGACLDHTRLLHSVK